MGKCIHCNEEKEKLFKDNTCSYKCHRSRLNNVLKEGSPKHNFIINNPNYEKTECPKCGRLIGKPNFNLHVTSCRGDVNCLTCGSKIVGTVKKFCNSSCSASYNNTHKTYGTRRSKFEVYCEEEIIKDFPNLTIDFNKKDTISSELDIYIPSLKLAFEINGITHYKPIYGVENLNRIQTRDKLKEEKCKELGITFIVIETIKCTKKLHNEFYLKIKNIVDLHIVKTNVIT